MSVTREIKGYTSITERLVSLISKSDPILNEIQEWLNYKYNQPDKNKIHDSIVQSISDWKREVEVFLSINEMKIERMIFSNTLFGTFQHIESPLMNKPGLLKQIEILKSAIKELLDLCLKIETRSIRKSITQVFIDDIDIFKEIVANVKPSEIDSKFTNSWFLEDVVEEEFLSTLGEPYKELDGGAETRDLYTDKITINGKRHTCAILFKGRAVRGPLRISNCGTNGTQLLRLAKNSFAQLYIIQHVNKIEPEITEALRDHILAHSLTHNIKICIIDGMETARFLKGRGLDLESMGPQRK
jgi:hypothetical protein